MNNADPSKRGYFVPGRNAALRERATALVRGAIFRGALSPEPCEVCGCRVVQAHHEDYAEPLMLRWLCGGHHRQKHYPNSHQLKIGNDAPSARGYRVGVVYCRAEAEARRAALGGA